MQAVKTRKQAIISNECVACGTCIKVCPHQAIKIYKGIHAEVNYDICVGCGKCKTVCPASVIEIKEKGDEYEALE